MIKDQEYLKSKASYCLDIAKKLGTVGYLSSLKRTKVGTYLIDESLSIESFQSQWKSTEI